MASGGGEAPPIPSNANGGEFLLSLLQRPNHHHPPHQQQQSQFPSQFPPFITPQLQNQHPQQQPLGFDPAVAAVGPSLPLLPHQLLQSNGRDLLSNTPPLWSHNLGFPQKNHAFPHPHPHGNQFQGNQYLADDLQRSGLSIAEVRANNNNNNNNKNNNNNNLIQHLPQQKQQLEHMLQFGSFSSAIPSPADGLVNANLMREVGPGSRNFNGLERNRHLEKQANSHSTNFEVRLPGAGSGGRGNLHKEQHQNYKSPPPGFSNKPRGGGGGGNLDHGGRRRELEQTMYREKGDCSELNNEKARRNEGSVEVRFTRQLDRPGPPPVSNLHSVLGSEIKESSINLDGEDGKDDGGLLDDLGEELMDSLLLEGESDGKKDKKKQSSKEFRSDSRGHNILSQRMRMLKRQMQCRLDIDRLNAAFLAIYESLVPLEEETAKQKQFFMLLEKLVSKEWPEARLYLYGSCANSFGVSKSDIDVCLTIEDAEINKSEVLLKLADILQADNLQNVQALTRARVPIVKLMDPVTGISCDICLNNVLAVVNTKLLRDYAQIDVRLRQLAFIVKHWAKSRGVNATYQGTLSSYAYVLMCIHFLQQRRPAILPCLQEMGTTYSAIVDDIRCAYFDQVEKLRGFGSRNKETIAQLVWAFFNYWAYRHDYANGVISVRTGSILSKREKDWTRRIGNDRHLICIEDPFEISHDLGRVVDKFSIKVLREEFERAADIMQHDPNPCVTLFEPYNTPR
ncbi:UTP:RNA uridylyltransferase 1 [Populus alba]|nr:UTP:RNA uridylyltransferase 1 [Populus alba]